MPMKKILSATLASAGILLLIMDGKGAVHSAAEGAALCLRTVIPSLFPFLFLCSIITSSLWGEKIPVFHILSRRMGIPQGGESLLLCAFLGGYPAGAQAIGTLFQDGRLSRRSAQRLLPLCNNAGPAFLFGMVALQFPQRDMAAALWLIQILSILFSGAFCAGYQESMELLPDEPPGISRILNRSLRTMAGICGWIVLFQILAGFLDRWFLWYFPQAIQVLIKGTLELSAGCCELHLIESPSLRFLICTVMLSFGGFCVTMQTASLIGGLSLSGYLRGKLIPIVSSVFLAMIYLQWGWPALVAAAAIILFSPVPVKNNCRFSELCDV